MAWFDLVILALPFIIVFLYYIMRLYFNKPIYYDPYGKESKKLPNYDKKIQFFARMIKDANRLDDKEIKIVADIDEIEKIIDMSSQKGFSIKAITGPMEGREFAPRPINEIQIIKARRRPINHFAIIGPHLIIESPHPKSFIGGMALGILYPNAGLYREFIRRFDQEWNDVTPVSRRPPEFTGENIVPSVDGSPSYFTNMSRTHDSERDN